MALLSAIPETHDIAAYAGDTYTLEIRAEAAVTDGKDWAAEVRTSKDSPVVDATFQITVPTVSGGPAYITLLAADTARLAGGAPVVQKRDVNGSVRAVQQYSGVFDCQVSLAGSDPVRTLVKGTITVELDVTRPA